MSNKNVNRAEAVTLGVDPGAQHVGLSVGKGWNVLKFDIVMPDEFLYILEGIEGIARLSVERFDIRQYTVEARTTVEVIGAIKWIARKKGWGVGFVNAADKMKFLNFISKKHPEIKSHAADAEAIRLWDLAYGKW